MLRKLKTIHWPASTKEQSLPAAQPSHAQEYASASVAAFLEHISPLAHGMEGKIASLRVLLRNAKMRVLDESGPIFDVCAQVWATYISGRKRKQTVIYLWVIALGIALGLVVELAMQVTTVLPN